MLDKRWLVGCDDTELLSSASLEVTTISGRCLHFFPSFRETSYVASILEEPRVYPHRAPGGDRHHRRTGRLALAGRAAGARSRPPVAVQEQPEADRPGPAPLRGILQASPA